MNLYLVQCGFYPIIPSLPVPIKNESHVHLLTCAESPEQAIKNIRKHDLFQNKEFHAHIDSIQIIHRVDGYNIIPTTDDTSTGKTEITVLDSPWKIEQTIKNVEKVLI